MNQDECPKVLHQSVLLQSAVDLLAVKPQGKYIDATVGSGGHAREILSRGGRVLGLDRDPEALKRAGRVLGGACLAPKIPSSGLPFTLVRANFVYLEKVAKDCGFFPADGVLFDLGVSSEQIEDGRRGFSFQIEASLDMRMDPDDPITAADLVNGLSERRLYALFSELAEEPRARAVAKLVVGARSVKPITTTGQLVKVVSQAYGGKTKVGGLHVATRVFQALRIAVNQELGNLRQVLPQAVQVLSFGGRLVVISFHSGEDRVVKQFLRKEEKMRILRGLTKKPIRPPAAEVRVNPRARSARLRAGEKIAND